jgi:hypothetical protein
MQPSAGRTPPLVVLILAAALPLSVWATPPSPADDRIRQFLARDHTPRAYRGTRRLEAANGDRTGWVEATTEYSRQRGFEYQVTAEGGSDYIRNNVLRPVLEGERSAFLRGEAARSALAQANYTFEASGVDADGLVNIRLSPRRKERMLVAGTMFLSPDDGALVRLQGRLAKNPSFWVKSVHIVKSYKRINNVVLPVRLDTSARLKLLGQATLRMTYAYSEIDGHRAADEH